MRDSTAQDGQMGRESLEQICGRCVLRAQIKSKPDGMKSGEPPDVMPLKSKIDANILKKPQHLGFGPS